MSYLRFRVSNFPWNVFIHQRPNCDVGSVEPPNETKRLEYALTSLALEFGRHPGSTATKSPDQYKRGVII